MILHSVITPLTAMHHHSYDNFIIILDLINIEEYTISLGLDKLFLPIISNYSLILVAESGSHLTLLHYD